MMNPSTAFHTRSLIAPTSTTDSVHVINDEDDSTTTTSITAIAATTAPRTTSATMFGYQEILEACRSFYNPPSEQMILPFKRLPPRIEDAVEMIEEHRLRQKRQKTGGDQVSPCSVQCKTTSRIRRTNDYRRPTPTAVHYIFFVSWLKLTLTPNSITGRCFTTKQKSIAIGKIIRCT